MRPVYKILFFCLLSRLFLFSLLFLFKGKEFDSSSTIYFGMNSESGHKDRFLLSLARWDAVHFCLIAEEGYLYESQHAFFPVYPMLSRYLAFLFQKLFLDGQLDAFAIRKTVFFSGIVISNISFLLSSIVLFYLSLSMTKSVSISFLSSILFSIQPASVFLSSMYTESFFILLCFSGMLFYGKHHRIVSTILWSIATATRSNGITMCGFFFYSLLFTPTLMTLLWSFIGPFFVFCSFFIVDCFTFYKITFMSDQNKGYSFKRPIYFDIQRKYWEVGLFSYYKKENIATLIWTCPPITFSLFGIFSYFWNYKNIKKNKTGFFDENVFPYIVLWLFMILYLLATVHVHIIYRLFSFLPSMYWYAAHLIINKEQKHLFFWIMLFFCSYTVLFAHFYPPC